MRLLPPPPIAIRLLPHPKIIPSYVTKLFSHNIVLRKTVFPVLPPPPRRVLLVTSFSSSSSGAAAAAAATARFHPKVRCPVFSPNHNNNSTSCCCSHQRSISTSRTRTTSTPTSQRSPFPYKQGQYNEQDPKVREYFYYVDHNGMLFLDDARMKNFTACFKEEKFLKFFFTRIVKTRVGEPSSSSSSPLPPPPPPVHAHFPYLSVCGTERNYIRCSDRGTPFVFTSFTSPDKTEFIYNNSGLTHPFNPASLYVGSNGRLYHEFKKNKHARFGLVKSSVADDISLGFTYRGDGDEEVVAKKPVAFSGGGFGVVRLDYSLEGVVEGALRGGEV